MTNRVQDSNGWFEIKKNPISKVGVFPYLGSEIGAPIPDKIYQVLRPATVLGSKSTMDSFKLIPLVNDHTMIGNKGIPAEKKGMHGVLGENISFDGKTLYSNLKVFSKELALEIDAGKKDLSLGYGCKYEFTRGVFDGVAYDAIQKNITGNHIALVDEGRMGKEVAVLDSSLILTCDSVEILRMKNEDKEKLKVATDDSLSMSALATVVNTIGEGIVSLTEGMDALTGKIAAMDEEYKKDKEAAKDEEKDKKKDDSENKGEDGDKDKGMDAVLSAIKTIGSSVESLQKDINDVKEAQDSGSVMSQLAERDTLAKNIETHVGTFDYSSMTKQQVAEYGAEKLGLDCDKGSEVIAVDAALKVLGSAGGGQTFKPANQAATDSATVASIDSMFNKSGAK